MTHRRYRRRCAPPAPVIDEAAFRAAVDDRRERRTALRRFVEDDGWAWTDVTGDPGPDR